MPLKNQFGFFMTRSDEGIFCNALRKEFPNVYFMDVKPSFEGNIDKRLFESIAESDSGLYSIVNFDLTTKDVLKTEHRIVNGYNYFCSVGIGQMQYESCEVNPENNLEVGCIMNSFDYGASDEDLKWQKMVYKILKKHGHKVHQLYIENNEVKLFEKPDDKVIAYNDAMEKYDGINNFMCWNTAKFINKNNLEKINGNDLLKNNLVQEWNDRVQEWNNRLENMEKNKRQRSTKK